VTHQEVIVPIRNGAPLGVSAVTAAGGASCMGPMEVPAKGYMSLATDPSSASFGLWQPLEHHGFEVIGEAGTRVWHQPTTRDYRARCGRACGRSS
jgi:uncharacterized protein